jgi:hypothetical protein
MGILSTFTIAIIGTFKAEPTNIRKWVEANGGKWSARVQKGVTHLIVSKEAWKKALRPVIQASEMKVWIVSFDWLEDSLQGKRKLPEKKYTWEYLKQERKKRRQLKKLGAMADGKKFLDGCKKIIELTGSGTSIKLPPTRKHKPSKSHFFAGVLDTPFVSATDDLKRRRAEREAAEAAEKAAKAAKKAKLSSIGTEQAPIEIEDEVPVQGKPSSTPPAPMPVTPARPTSEQSKLPTPPPSAAASPVAAEKEAKKQTLKDLYHYYLDSTGFEYKVTVVRSNFAINSISRYQISILESHTKPHVYCTLVHYVPPAGGAPAVDTGTPVVSLRNPLLNFLKNADNAVRQEKNTCTQTITNAQKSAEHPEAARLTSLITPPSPSPTVPYKSLIAPMNSPFDRAWLAFRHAFRDLTLLSWEERFDTNKTVQKARAKALNIEPFVYSKPALGMPVGLRVQEAGLYQANPAGAPQSYDIILGDAEDGYVRNAFKLPGIEEQLSKNGFVGSAIQRDEEVVRKREEAVQRKVEEQEELERKRRGIMKQSARVNYNKPLFNCATGRPRSASAGVGLPGSRSNYGGLIRQVKPFPSGPNFGYEE